MRHCFVDLLRSFNRCAVSKCPPVCAWCVMDAARVQDLYGRLPAVLGLGLHQPTGAGCASVVSPPAAVLQLSLQGAAAPSILYSLC